MKQRFSPCQTIVVLLAGQVTDGAIGMRQLAAGAVGLSQIADGAVGSSKLADGAITSAKLAPDAVTTDHIADGTITQADLDLNDLGTAFWKTGGNSGTAAGVNYVGTTDFQPLELRVNGVRGLRLEPNTNAPNVNVIGGMSNRPG